ncbi:uncharacterized protein B0H18DRAFT_986310 [Fomitopsis serialis]|uniref:uncharacterized protein n=1 Tax=Fomitopsis serialis TaxID=139415 RepID=UPI0020081447|nr:uncharacterized protein B0H18DRAFT_986310 [Neoantrodia serialis]KAH9932575.1 hypothetical protein B0H18DRAFT_986310 [Neoantrodia serialis]
MSSESQEITGVLNSTFVTNCCYISSLALYVFDQCLNSGRIIEYLWQRKMTASTALFVLLHISALLTLLFDVAVLTITDCKTGYALTIMFETWEAVQGIVIAAITALRVYAIGGRDWKVTAVVFILQLPFVAEVLYDCSLLVTYVVAPPVGCVFLVSNARLYNKLNLLGVVTVLVADAIVLVVTWRHTYGMKKMAAAAHLDVSLTSLLLRDGTVYFSIRLILDLLSLLMQYTNETAGIDNFITPFLAMLLSRFFLNLRDVALVPNASGQTKSSQMSDIGFAHSHHQLGGSLTHGLRDVRETSDESDSNAHLGADVSEESGELEGHEHNGEQDGIIELVRRSSTQNPVA